MPKKVEITCDFCQKDLTTVESGFDEYRFHLSAEGIYNTSNISFGAVRSHPMKNDCYFCDLSCLEGWLTQRVADVCTHPRSERTSNGFQQCLDCGEIL